MNLLNHWHLVVYTFVVFVLDLLTPLGVATGVAYIGSVMLAPDDLLKKTMVVCILLTVVGYFLSPEYGDHWQVIANRHLSVIFIIFCTLYVNRVKADL